MIIKQTINSRTHFILQHVEVQVNSRPIVWIICGAVYGNSDGLLLKSDIKADRIW